MRGEIPIRRTFRVVNGGTPTSDPENWDGDVPFATPADLALVDGRHLIETARTITNQGLSGSTRVPAGSLLLSTRAPIGYVAETTAATAFNQGCRALVPRGPVDLRFMRYQLLASRQRLLAAGQGTTFSELSTDALSSITVRVPPMEEQNRIADFLDAETARIDALIERKQQMVELLNERFFELRRSLVTGGLDPAVDFRATNVEWLRSVPRHWATTKLGYLGEIRSGSTPTTTTEDYWDGDIPWVSPKDMKRPIISSTEDNVTEAAVRETGLKIIDPPAVLFVVRGMILAHTFPVAMSAVPLTINQDMKALTLTRDDPRYISQLLTGMSGAILALLVEESAHGTRALRMDRWKDFPLFLPPVAEQHEIADRLTNEAEQVERASSVILAQVNLLRERRHTLITAAVTGELDLVEAA